MLPLGPFGLGAFDGTLISAIRALGLQANCKLCLDAGDASSYDGASQTWSDVSGNATDFLRGTTSGAEASDPTFNGAAGGRSSAEYFSGDGGDSFTLKNAVPAWVSNLHKDGAKWGWLYVGYSNAFAGANPCYLSTGVLPGIRIMNPNAATVELQVFDNASGNALTKITTQTLTTGTFYCLGLSIDENAGATGGFFWKNAAYLQSTTDQWNPSYTSPGAGAAPVFNIGRDGSGAADVRFNLDRWAAMAMWEGYAPTKTDFDAIYALMKSRWGLP